MEPATVIRWHREGFRRFWRWRSRPGRLGRPGLDREVVSLIRRMSQANMTWGAPRIRNELARLGIEVAVPTVAKYMARRRKPPSPTWRAFLENHLKDLVALDFFVVPTATFAVLFGLVVLSHHRRRVVHFNATAHPTAEWTVRQFIQAFPEETAPRFLVRDRDKIFGERFRRAIEVLGIEEVVTAARSPWQNPYAERLIGSLDPLPSGSSRRCPEASTLQGPELVRSSSPQRLAGSTIDTSGRRRDRAEPARWL